MKKEIKVTFEPSGRSVYVLPGTILLEAAARAGFILETPCGGSGKCGKCVVRVTSEGCADCERSRTALGEEKFKRGFRLACQCRVQKSLMVEIPESSLFQTGQQILSHDSGEKMEIHPTVTRTFVQLPRCSQEDPLPDAERIQQGLGSVQPDISVLRTLPGVLRKSDFGVTVTRLDDRVVTVESGNTGGGCYGVAFDIGTTTVVGTLVDLKTGSDLAVASLVNPQISFGDDVISRIRRCRDEAEGLPDLVKAIRHAVNAILAELGKKSGKNPERFYEAVIAGNTTMQEILCGIDPSPLGELPFVPAFRDSLSLRATDTGFHINPAGQVYVFPQIGGFVGGDTVAGIIATRLDQSEKPVLLVDVGTNGEIVLAHEGRLTATSVAAGPAFEGARIVNGMRATRGAIEKVIFNADVSINVIGNAKPAGLCGTGLIDAVACLLRAGILDITGRILGPEEVEGDLPSAIRARITEDNGQYNFVLAHASESANGEPLYLYQKDVRELQLANGAIRAGIAILLNAEALQPTDLSGVLLAGAFGNFIRRNNARRIGMLPQIPTDHIRFVGNAASFGAKRALLSHEARKDAARVARETRHLDLSLSPQFQMEFGNAMIFPDHDLD